MTSAQEPEITGYAEPWINSPGDLVGIKVSSTESLYRYRLVRLIQGFEHSHAPEKKIEAIKAVDPGTVSGRYQRARPGSYAVVDNLGLTASHVGINIEFFFQPSLIDCTRDQVLASIMSPTDQAGIEIAIDRDGFMVISIHTGDGSSCREQTQYSPTVGRWTSIKCRALWNMIEVSAKSHPSLDGIVEGPSEYHQKITTEKPFNVPKPGRATLAARGRVDMDDGFFNGRIEDVTIRALGAQGHTQVLAQYDFSREMASDSIFDVSRNSRHGYLINAPTRAVRGHNWDGKEVDWTKATYGYGAIHFHEDDLDDAQWETDFEIKLPADLRSGAYAVEVESIGQPHVRDDITFFVRPRPDSSARIAVVLSTFTYLAYANERMFDQTIPSHLAVPGEIQILEDENYKKMLRRRDLGHSLYDVHRDLSGTVFSSSKRPLLNVRPGYEHWAFRRPREFSADLLMIGFLEQLSLPYDVCLDHDLHTDGIEAIARYSTLITGSHPEYPTIETLDAYSEFQRRGGSLLYLGGNGFYWVAAVDPARPHRVEVRRGDQGVRTFALPGGEHHHSLTGAKGGLWRSRGRQANYLVGLGCCGEGIGPGVPYKRSAKSYNPEWAWAFSGIDPSLELLGVNGFGGGASGDEIDRFDAANGSPAGGTVLATSIGHSDDFGLFPEDCQFPMVNTLGTQTDLVRSDIVAYYTSFGGLVFSVGSINWYCSLAWDSYNNEIARLTENVIRKTLDVSDVTGSS